MSPKKSEEPQPAKEVAPAEVSPEEEAPKSEPPTVKKYPGGWQLVTAGSWEVSVGPDGLITLPRHLKPEETADFISAVTTAAEVGARARAASQEAAASDNRSPASRHAMVQRGVPPGGVQVPIMPRGKLPPGRPHATIGRRGTNRSLGPQPAGNMGMRRPQRVVPPPKPPGQSQ